MVCDIGYGLKSTISTVAAARTFATDPRNVVTLTSSLIIWVDAGLHKKYGDGLDPKKQEIISKITGNWMTAQQYIKSLDNWDQALMRCHEVANECIRLAVIEDLIDYDVFDDTVTERLFGGAGAKDKVE